MPKAQGWDALMSAHRNSSSNKAHMMAAGHGGGAQQQRSVLKGGGPLVSPARQLLGTHPDGGPMKVTMQVRGQRGVWGGGRCRVGGRALACTHPCKTPHLPLCMHEWTGGAPRASRRR